MKKSQHRTKERILTQPHPARVGHGGAGAVVLKARGLFLVTNTAGDVPFERPHAFGLYLHDCRFLGVYTLRINGATPTALAAASVHSYETHHYLVNPEQRDARGRTILPRNSISVRRQRLIRAGVVHELMSLHNYGRAPAALRLELRYGAAFDDVFVVKRFVDGPRGRTCEPARPGHDRVELSYEGRDRIRRVTTLRFSPPPSRLDGARAEYDLRLEPGERRAVAIAIRPLETVPGGEDRTADGEVPPPHRLRRWLQRSEDAWVGRATVVRSSNPLFDRVMQRALLDLRLLQSKLDGREYFAAGIPWFVTLFGRDSALAALQTLPYGLGTAADTLRLLARYQAAAFDEYRDAAPGKILHELRVGELAKLGAIPQSPAYYGSVDATPLFLMLLAEHVRWSGDLATARELRPHVDAALGWMEGPADSDGDGYLDYRGRYGTGLVNQGWKDSGDAIVNADGSLPDPPIALCEVQGYAFRAWRDTAEILRLLGDDERARALMGQADAMRDRFERDFWDESLGCYVLARQAGGRPATVVASNAGQVLWTGIAARERAARVTARLLARDMFSGWGIRTLSSEAAAYNPLSYHRGSVWPHDNALILSGFTRYGHAGEAIRVFDALFEAASNLPEYRLPEVYAGVSRSESEHRPVPYPVACSPQAWASGALPSALWSLLGLAPSALEGRLQVVRPRLPRWLEWVELRGLRLGRARLTLRIERHGETEARVAAVDVHEGTVKVEVDDDAA
ncbi:MAG TPA: glycogen debranching N-terminal domain-containing protein [Methylomirabilota bacterium]|nr:glycogen debranching N-terminal domain-containing protein [Methylomirabilota bacterium]